MIEFWVYYMENEDKNGELWLEFEFEWIAILAKFNFCIKNTYRSILILQDEDKLGQRCSKLIRAWLIWCFVPPFAPRLLIRQISLDLGRGLSKTHPAASLAYPYGYPSLFFLSFFFFKKNSHQGWNKGYKVTHINFVSIHSYLSISVDKFLIDQLIQHS